MLQQTIKDDIVSLVRNVVNISFHVSVPKDGWTEQFLVRFLGSVLVPFHKGNDVLCAAMQKVQQCVITPLLFIYYTVIIYPPLSLAK